MMWKTRLRAVSVLFLGASLGLGLAAPSTALAQNRDAPTQRAPVSGKVSIEVLVVHATDTGSVDPKLKDVRANLSHTNFKGFKLLKTETARLSAGGNTSLTLVGNLRMKVTVLSRNQSQAKVRIVLLKEGDRILDTTVTIPKGKYIMIGGPRYKGGKVILPVGVDF